MGKHRELRGLTATGKKARGMNQRGHKAMKKRPSRRSDWKNRNTQKFWRYRKHSAACSTAIYNTHPLAPPTPTPSRSRVFGTRFFLELCWLQSDAGNKGLSSFALKIKLVKPP